MPRVFLYLLDHDTGYAPNPFHGWCTLAGCKPQIRKSAAVGDWVIGVTPKSDGHRVAFVMLIEEKFPVSAYWGDRRFRAKRRRDRPATPLQKCADNLRCPRDDDPDRAYVLASRHFAYYGSKPRNWPARLRGMRMPALFYLVNHDPETLRALISYARKRRRGIHAPPRSWKPGDDSWRQDARRAPCG